MRSPLKFRLISALLIMIVMQSCEMEPDGKTDSFIVAVYDFFSGIFSGAFKWAFPLCIIYLLIRSLGNKKVYKSLSEEDRSYFPAYKKENFSKPIKIFFYIQIGLWIFYLLVYRPDEGTFMSRINMLIDSYMLYFDFSRITVPYLLGALSGIGIVGCLVIGRCLSFDGFGFDLLPDDFETWKTVHLIFKKKEQKSHKQKEKVGIKPRRKEKPFRKKENPLLKYSASKNDKPEITGKSVMQGNFDKVAYLPKSNALILNQYLKIEILDAATGVKIKEYENDGMEEILGIHASPATNDFIVYGISDTRFSATSIRFLNLDSDKTHDYSSHQEIFDGARDFRTFSTDASFEKSLAASSGRGNGVFLYDLAHHNIIRKIKTPLTSSVRLLADRKQLLVSGGAENTPSVELWNVLDNKCIRQYKGSEKWYINDIDLSPDGKLLIGAGGDKNVWMWDFETGELLGKYSGHSERVIKVQFIRGGKSFCSKERDGKILFWNTGNKNAVFAIEDFSKYLSDMYINNEGTLIYASSSDEGLLEYKLDWGDIEQEEPKIQQSTSAKPGKESTAKSETENLEITLAKAFDCTSDIKKLELFSKEQRVMTFSPNDAIVWDINTGDVVCQRDINSYKITALHMLEETPLAMYVHESDLFIYNVSNDDDPMVVKTECDTYSHSTGVISNDGKSLYLLSKNFHDKGILEQFDLKTGKRLMSKPKFCPDNIVGVQGPAKIALSADEKQLFIYGGLGGTEVYVFDIKTGKELACMISHPGAPGYADRVSSFSYYKGSKLAIVPHGSDIRIWDMKKYTCLKTFERKQRSSETYYDYGKERIQLWKKDLNTPYSGANAVAMYHNYVVLGDMEGWLHLFDPADGSYHGQVKAHDKWITDIKVDNLTGKVYTIGDSDKTLKVWDFS